jgi:hypothetical protein
LIVQLPSYISSHNRPRAMERQTSNIDWKERSLDPLDGEDVRRLYEEGARIPISGKECDPMEHAKHPGEL